MQPTELRALIEEAIRQGLTFSWLPAALAVVLVAAAAFVVEYLKTKAADRAANENFAAIRNQLQTTTRDTEEIKQLLSGDAWRQQKAWEARERYYSTLLTHLHEFRVALFNLSAYYDRPGSEHTEDSDQGPAFQEHKGAGFAAVAEVRKLVGPAALYLSQEAVDALQRLSDDHWNLAEYSPCTAMYVEDALPLADKAYDKVLAEARTQLNLARAH